MKNIIVNMTNTSNSFLNLNAILFDIKVFSFRFFLNSCKKCPLIDISNINGIKK